jgi:hypothetical protein
MPDNNQVRKSSAVCSELPLNVVVSVSFQDRSVSTKTLKIAVAGRSF